jgi:outer membrane protein
MRSLLSLFFVLMVFSLQSQALTLTWKEAVDLAQKNSLELQASLESYRSAEELETGIYSGFLPHISASASGTQGGSPSGPITNTYTAQLTATQNLFSGFSDLNNYWLRKTSTQQALATLNSVKSRLSQELKEAYASVYYQQDYRKLLVDIVKRRKENYRNVKLQYDVGRENQGSLLLSESYVESAEYDQMTAEHGQEILIENLRRVLGLASTEPIEITDNIPKEELKDLKPDFQALAQKFPDVLSAQYAEQSSLYNLRITRAGFLPSLDLSGSYGYSDTKFFPSNDRWSVGLTLSIPLFDGFKTYASSSSGSATYKANKLTSQNLVMLTEKNIKRAFYDYVEAIQKEKIDLGFSKAAILRAEVARNKYKNGFITFEDWDIVETDLIAKQTANLASERNRIVKQSLWEQAQGIGVFE